MLAALQALAAIASLVASLKSIFEDHDRINDQLNQLLTDLLELRIILIRSIKDILQAIAAVVVELDEQFASTNIALVDRALFNDLAIFNDKEEAMGNSLEAATALVQQSNVTFASSLMYVVNIRLAIMKDFDPNYFCRQDFRDEFQRYFQRLGGWIRELNELISRTHTVRLEEVSIVNPENEVVPQFWRATHYRNGVKVASFNGRRGDLGDETADRVLAQAEASRQAGIEADRRQFGVVEMEKTLGVWQQAFRNTLRPALVAQVLNRHAVATDFYPDGIMVDGRILTADLDLRTTLMELLVSREFQVRVEKTWNAFVRHGDNRFVQFVYRRLFDRDATDEQVLLLRGISTNYGYAAFIAALVRSRDYEERYGNGLPTAGEPVIRALQAAKANVSSPPT